MLRREFESVQFAQNFDPPHRPLNVVFGIDILERAKSKVSVGSGEIVEFATGSGGKHPDGIASVKCEDLRAGIPKPLCGDKSECCRFARSRWTDNQRVTEI